MEKKIILYKTQRIRFEIPKLRRRHRCTNDGVIVIKKTVLKRWEGLERVGDLWGTQSFRFHCSLHFENKKRGKRGKKVF